MVELVLGLEGWLDEALPEDLIGSWQTIQDVRSFVSLRMSQGADVDLGGKTGSRPPGEGSHVRLVAPRHDHIPDVRSWAVAPDNGWRWQLRGRSASHEEIAAFVFGDSLATFVVERSSDGAPVGLVSARNASLANGFAYLSALLHPRLQGQGWPAEGLVLFVDFLFRTFDLRKLYCEVIEPNLPQFESAIGRLLVEEGRLRAHEWCQGEWVDLVILGLYRDVFEDSRLARDHEVV